MCLRLFFGIGTLNLRFNQSPEVILKVPPGTIALRLAQLNNELRGCRATKRVNVYPGYARE